MRTLGIVGGMGPLATHDFYRKVIEATPADDDPQHIPVVMVADTQIPLRIPAWEGRGPSPLPALLAAARHCMQAGATVLAMPCNTAHYWFDAIVRDLPGEVRFIHIADAALREAQHALQATRSPRLALAGTHATVAMRLYQDAALRLGLDVPWLLPDAPLQARITQAIADVKAGRIDAAIAAFQAALDGLAAQGAQAIVLGCTELPVIAPRMRCDVPLVDATAALARACVQACLRD
jgi:aspartate racemase